MIYMKHYLQLLFTIIALTFSISASAVDWHFGPTVGYENSKIDFQAAGENISFTNLSGFNIGGLVEFLPIDYFGIQSGLSFVMNGYWMRGTYQENVPPYARYDAEVKSFLYYFMFPLVLEGKIPVTDSFTINVECGPQFYAGLDSKTTLTIHGYNGYQDHAQSWYKGIFDKTLSRFNCTILLAGGLQYEGFRLMAGYNFGVYNMFIDGADMVLMDHKINKNDDSFKLGGFVINFTYMF